MMEASQKLFSSLIILIVSCLILALPGCSEQSFFSHRPDANRQIADKALYLKNISEQLSKKWPDNRTVNIICHGHSVPAGYFATPVVDTFNSYPHLLHQALKKKFPFAVINVIVTAIGGENSISGGERFKADVLDRRPDIILIDYALNDRGSGLLAAETAWSQMIEQALNKDVKVLLMTPTPDINHIPGKLDEQLNMHAEQIRALAAKYNIGLVDSLAVFDDKIKKGGKVGSLLSNNYNHPNTKGHQIVTGQILKWFP